MATTYKVVSGDTASQIAAKYGTTVTALQQANPQYSQFVSNPNYIQAGWTLNIPTTTATAGSNAPTNASQLTSLTQQLAEAQKKLTTISSQLSTAKEAGYVPGTGSGKAEIKYTPEGEIIPYKVAYPESNLPKTTDTVAYTQGIQNEVMQARTQLESAYQKQIEDLRAQQEAAQKKIETITSQQKDLLETDIKTLLQPWQADLEKAERERLKVEENYFANQKSIAELEQLLNQALTDIQSAEAVTGLSSIRSPRIAQIRQDYEARAGVIQAVMAARNNQIAVANNLIDRSVSAITNDKNAQLQYYQNLYNFYEKQRTEEGNKLIQLSQTERQYINAQIGLLENDLKQVEATANYIKELMINPQTAQALEGAGVKLTDSVATINKKLADYAYAQEVANTANQLASQGFTQLLPGQKAPAGAQVITIKDSRGKETKWYATPGTNQQIVGTAETGYTLISFDDAGNIIKKTPITAGAGVGYGAGYMDFTDQEKRRLDQAGIDWTTPEGYNKALDYLYGDVRSSGDWINAEQFIQKNIAAGYTEPEDITDIYMNIKQNTKLTDSDIKALMAAYGMVNYGFGWAYVGPTIPTAETPTEAPEKTGTKKNWWQTTLEWLVPIYGSASHFLNK